VSVCSHVLHREQEAPRVVLMRLALSIVVNHDFTLTDVRKINFLSAVFLQRSRSLVTTTQCGDFQCNANVLPSRWPKKNPAQHANLQVSTCVFLCVIYSP
jgi:hypothetical protein